MELIETKFQIWKFVGYLSVSAGLIGIGYISWIYGIWVRTLPVFPSNSEFFQSYTDSPTVTTLGFGNLLIEPVVKESPEVAIISGLEIDRPVLGTATETPVDVSKVMLTVPALNIKDANVELQVDGENEHIYDGVLTYAVAHLRNSALPGDFGNAFLFGHSKLPIFAGSDYESIFTNLPKLKTGDVISVTYQGSAYTYQIRQTGVVNPDAVYVMHQPENKKMLTLMTCIPPGFDNQRFITVGELIAVAKV